MIATETPQKRFQGLSAELFRSKDIHQTNGASTVSSAVPVLYVLERVAATLCLIGLLPFLLVLALVISVASRASPLVAHRRVGRYGKTLWVYKFRTMWPAAKPGRKSGFFIETVTDERPEPKRGPDPRVTSAFAGFCRRHSIDELPQLALVAAGQMSVVGPRPITRFELSEHYEPNTSEVLSIKPGLTGLWQVRGRSRLTYRQRKRFDLFLVRRFSIGLYLRIIGLTIPDGLFGKDAW
jgi:lipopolysaccharide/colanic/teichoic acid biosynthesis glycosyltransferase